jgi:hypothetical protein
VNSPMKLDEAIAVAAACGLNVANDVGFARRVPGSQYYRPAPNGRDDSPSDRDVSRVIADLTVRARVASQRAGSA